MHEDMWRERLIDNGIDDAVLRPSLSLDVLELPDELDGLDFDDIAEHTLDVSSTSADVEPLRLVDLFRETPRQESSSGSVVDITDRVAQVIEIDRGVDAAVEASTRSRSCDRIRQVRPGRGRSGLGAGVVTAHQQG
ncbi:MAG: hypothetical protein U5O16_20780, partial [Rhodococcus sp. (in: high G+C Gram-positive bacteria)]|nr:hypothetical protein [Rhodococcus sp. (in: high G+C Gram-positive bacteria)]